MLTHDSIVPDNPPTVRFSSGTDVLSVSTLARSDDASHLRVVGNPGDSTFLVDFDFLDPGEGIAVQFIHTGKDLDVVTLEGRLKEKGTFEFGDPWNRAILISPIFFGLFGFLALIFAASYFFPAPTLPLWAFLTGLTILFTCVVVFFILFTPKVSAALVLRPARALAPYVPPINAEQRNGKMIET
jgi:hypothetical protein